MRTNVSDFATTAIAPVIWGSTYLVTTEMLPEFSPITVAMLRALPAGLMLMMIVRELPAGIWWLRAFLLGALNISIFLTMLFVAAYRLPGGVAGTVLSAQPLIVVFLGSLLLSSPVRASNIIGALVGMGGVALLVLTPSAALDAIGVAAGLAGATSMALGSILARRWRPPVSPLTFTAWQLTAGGLLLLPVALLAGHSIPVPTVSNLLGLVWLGLIGAAFTYALWFRGIARLPPSIVSSLLFLSPLTAVLLGWGFLGQTLAPLQVVGIALVIGSIWLSQRTNN
ncbi:DMT family transporter [Sinorhizobium meliloti]|uniref:EamA family transporter n=1 Tax=Rhizobium meliloti TaxID=382 RepID=UPI003F166F59